MLKWNWGVPFPIAHFRYCIIEILTLLPALSCLPTLILGWPVLFLLVKISSKNQQANSSSRGTEVWNKISNNSFNKTRGGAGKMGGVRREREAYFKAPRPVTDISLPPYPALALVGRGDGVVWLKKGPHWNIANASHAVISSTWPVSHFCVLWSSFARITQNEVSFSRKKGAVGVNQHLPRVYSWKTKRHLSATALKCVQFHRLK